MEHTPYNNEHTQTNEMCWIKTCEISWTEAPYLNMENHEKLFQMLSKSWVHLFKLQFP